LAAVILNGGKSQASEGSGHAATRHYLRTGRGPVALRGTAITPEIARPDCGLMAHLLHPVAQPAELCLAPRNLFDRKICMSTVLIIGSGPTALDAAQWPRSAFDEIVVINNAWRVREDWSYLIHPDDFPQDRCPDQTRAGQLIVTSDLYVPAQNTFGGFVFAGGTMAFTAAYWTLHALRPSVIAVFGCDMVYPAASQTHFYGTGTADPLRKDVTLRSLEAKSCRLRAFAARQDCALVNLSAGESRLSIPKVTLGDLTTTPPKPARLDQDRMDRLIAQEEKLGYFVESGRYWDCEHLFDPAQIDGIDRQWLALFDEGPLAAAGPAAG
jgi:hypothetical protein